MLRHHSGYRVGCCTDPRPRRASSADGPLQARPPPYGHLCLAVRQPDQVDTEFARLVAAGAGVRIARSRARPAPGWHSCRPYGNLIELIDRVD